MYIDVRGYLENSLSSISKTGLTNRKITANIENYDLQSSNLAQYYFNYFSDRLRSGNVALSHLYCTAFTYHTVEKDFADKEEEGWVNEYREEDESTSLEKTSH